MAIWNACKMNTLYYSGDVASENNRCVVKLDGDRVLVEYEADGQIYQYLGTEAGAGHYQLACAENGGRASLHRFADSVFLEGSWVEGGARGMWRIELDDERG